METTSFVALRFLYGSSTEHCQSVGAAGLFAKTTRTLLSSASSSLRPFQSSFGSSFAAAGLPRAPLPQFVLERKAASGKASCPRSHMRYKSSSTVQNILCQGKTQLSAKNINYATSAPPCRMTVASSLSSVQDVIYP